MYLQPESARLTAKAIARMAGYRMDNKNPQRLWYYINDRGSHMGCGYETEEQAAMHCCIREGLIDQVMYANQAAG